MSHSVPVLIISGPVGVGKTSVASEVSEILITQNVPHTFIDLDQLRYTYPRPTNDRFGERLGLQNLQAIWTNCVAVGSSNLVLSTVLEEPQEAQAITAVIPGGEAHIYQLWANPETLEARVRQREHGDSLEWHLARSLELAQSLPINAPADLEIWTDDRNIHDIAKEITQNIHWIASSN